MWVRKEIREWEMRGERGRRGRGVIEAEVEAEVEAEEIERIGILSGKGGDPYHYFGRNCSLFLPGRGWGRRHGGRNARLAEGHGRSEGG
jgi:hypothetical protein